MTFKDVVLKNFKARLRCYLSYFLCSSFSIMIFFMYSTLLFNPGLNKSPNIDKMLLLAAKIPGLILVLFSMFFINYSHTSFIKARKSEFGVFMLLGMAVKDIRKIIIIENGIIAACSVILGILSGTVFSKLFFLIVLKMMDIQDIAFALTYKSFLLTIGVFCMIFGFVIFTSTFSIIKIKPAEMIKSTRKYSSIKRASYTAGTFGILMVIGSLWLLSASFNDYAVAGKALVFCTVVCFIGLYITISQTGSFLIAIFKRRKKVYFKNILLLKRIEAKLKQTKKIIFIISMLVSVTVFFTGIYVYLLMTAEESAVKENPQHLAFVQVDGINKIPQNEIEDALNKSITPVKDKKTLPILFCQMTDRLGSIPVVSEKNINRFGGFHFKVEKGHFITLDQQVTLSELERKRQHIDQLTFQTTGGKKISFACQEEVYKVFITRVNYTLCTFIVLGDEDYNAYKAFTDEKESGIIQLVNFSDWKKSAAAADAVKSLIEKYYMPVQNEEYLQRINEGRNNKNILADVGSRVLEYRNTLQSASLLLFLTGFIGLFFFIASGSVLYLKLFSEVSSDRENFKILSRIGMSGSEMKKKIYVELGIVFFVPLLAGIIIGLVYVCIFASEIEAISKVSLIAGLYIVIQTVYYLTVRRLYIKRITTV